MRIAVFTQRLLSLGMTLAALLCLAQAGCITGSIRAIPATRLPDVYKAQPKCENVPVNLTLLRQEPPTEYTLDAGDVVGVYVPTLVPRTAPGAILQLPTLGGTGTLFRDVYPPGGITNTPNLGVPMTIGSGGILALPEIQPVNLSGKTLSEAADLIQRTYSSAQKIPEGQPISLTLVKPRVYRVLVMREDVGPPQPSTSPTPQLIQKAAYPYTRRGSGDLIDLPAYENDVLHVLAATGGLPGIETFSHIWVLKSASPEINAEARARLEAGEDAAQVFRALNAQRAAIRIPLRIKAGQPLPFGPQDVILHTGDIVYLEPRDVEVFYTGGLLPGGQIPLPRDHDIDIMEAVALANGQLGGIVNAAQFRSGAGPGAILPASRAVVVRKLANGQEIMIRCDLNRARFDPTERIIIQPGDFVMMHYKPGELVGNAAANFFQFTWVFSTN